MPFQEKYLSVQPVSTIGGRQVKNYHVNLVDAPIAPEIQSAAEQILPRLFPDPDGTPPATFAVLHRGETASYLVAYSWVWDNVMHCASAAAGSEFLGCPDTDPTHFIELNRPWIGCVWEVPPITHERDAWVRHMLVPDEANLAGYLADSMPPGRTGPV
ncbi:MAG TPA: hypothetical protein VGN81_01590 [Pseudonocardiaceae bacterium]